MIKTVTAMMVNINRVCKVTLHGVVYNLPLILIDLWFLWVLIGLFGGWKKKVSVHFFFSLRKQATFRDANTGFPVTWRLKNERRNFILMTCHYADLGCDTSSLWNFCARSSNVTSRGNQCWHREMSAVFHATLSYIPRKSKPNEVHSPVFFCTQRQLPLVSSTNSFGYGCLRVLPWTEWTLWLCWRNKVVT